MATRRGGRSRRALAAPAYRWGLSRGRGDGVAADRRARYAIDASTQFTRRKGRRYEPSPDTAAAFSASSYSAATQKRSNRDTSAAFADHRR